MRRRATRFVGWLLLALLPGLGSAGAQPRVAPDEAYRARAGELVARELRSRPGWVFGRGSSTELPLVVVDVSRADARPALPPRTGVVAVVALLASPIAAGGAPAMPSEARGEGHSGGRSRAALLEAVDRAAQSALRRLFVAVGPDPFVHVLPR